MYRSWIASAFGIVLSVTALHATSVQVPTFQQLVDQSDAIVVTEVLDRQTRWERAESRNLIVTVVTVRVHEVIKGRSDAVRTFKVLGGTIGEVTQRVPGTPLFLVGDRDVLFLTARPGLLSPVIGVSHGRFRVVPWHTGSGEYIANDARQPVASIQNYARPQRLAAAERPLTLTDFRRAILSSIGR